MKDFEEVVSSVVKDDSRYLLLKKDNDDGYNYWEFPGGSLEEYDETPLQGMSREFEEELGYSMADCVSELRGFNPYLFENDRKAYKVHPHEVKLSERIEPELSEEHADYAWVSRRDIDKMNDAGNFNRNQLENLKYMEFSGPARYDLLGRDSQEPVVELSPGESMDDVELGPVFEVDHKQKASKYLTTNGY